MKTKYLFIVLAIALLLHNAGAAPLFTLAVSAGPGSGQGESPRSCTVFMASFGDTVLFGNNEDYYDPDYYYWVEPPARGTYGVFYLGSADLYPQGAVNDKGLAFDATAVPRMPLNPHPERPNAPDGILRTMMQQAATVEEAVAIAETYNWGTSLAGQFQVADATGNSVVIGPGPDGELAFTRKPGGDGYLASTNFNRAYPQSHYGDYPDWRYDAAVRLLGQISGEADLTPEAFRAILDATHQEGVASPTIYSNIIDLRQGVIYFYYGHAFAEVARLDIAREIDRGTMPTRIRTLFSRATRQRAEEGLPQPWRTLDRLTPLAWAWLALTAGSLATLMRGLLTTPRPPIGLLLAWVVTVLVFGPLGLAVYLLSKGRSDPLSPWLQAAASTLGRTAGYALWVSLVFVYHIAVLRNFKLEVEPASVLLVTYALPFLFSLFALAGPHAASRLGLGYWLGVRRAAVAEYVFITLGVVSIIFTMEILGSWLFPGAMDLSSPVFWLMLVIVALVAAIAVYPVSYWMARRGSPSWAQALLSPRWPQPSPE